MAKAKARPKRKARAPWTKALRKPTPPRKKRARPPAPTPPIPEFTPAPPPTPPTPPPALPFESPPLPFPEAPAPPSQPPAAVGPPKRDWSRVGNVPWNSKRGLLALGLVALPLGWILLNFVATLVQVFAQEPITIEPTRELLYANMVVSWILFFGLPVLAVAVAHWGEPHAVWNRLGLQLTRRTPLHLALGVGVTIASLVLLALILTLIAVTTGYQPEESPVIEDLQKLLTPDLLIIIPITAGVCEEVFFRGLLQPRLGLVGASILFALVHLGYGTVLQLIVPLILGFVYGYLFYKTRSLWPPIAAHVSFNAIQLAIAYYSPGNVG